MTHGREQAGGSGKRTGHWAGAAASSSGTEACLRYSATLRPAAAASSGGPARCPCAAAGADQVAGCLAPLVAAHMPHIPALRHAQPPSLALADGLPPASFAAWDAARTRTAVKGDISSFVLGVLINLAALHSLNLDSRGRSYLACLSVIYLRGLWMCVCHPEAHRVQPRSGPRSRCGAAAASGGTAAGLLSGTCSAHLPPCIPGAGAQGEGAAYA